MQLRNLLASVSDHSPIFLETEVTDFIRPNRFFRFENKWLMEPDLKSCVEGCWSEAHDMGLLDKL